MSDSIRKLILDTAAQLSVDAKKVIETIAHADYRGNARRLTEGADRYCHADGRGHRAVSESTDRIATPDGRGTRTVTGPDHEPTGPQRPLAPALDPRGSVNHYGRPQDQRRYPVDDYIRMWERHHGRRMTAEERAALAQGCIGVTKIGIGRTRLESVPPMNLAFADPRSHRAVQNAENILAPGEIANAEVKTWRRLRTQAENVVRQHGMNWSYTDKDGAVRSAAEHIPWVEENLERARAEARQVWSNLAKGDIRELLDARQAARVEGDIRTFEHVRDHVQKFENLLATGPVDTDEFMRLVRADPDLNRLHGVDHELPSGNPSEWKPVIYSKHFWSGQQMVRDSSGNLAFTGNQFATGATETPDATRFAPDPATGQVNMAGDYGHPKPGYVSFDYGLYDEQTGNWWHANHADYRVYSRSGDPVSEPMQVYQSTSEKFFTSYSDFDSSVICIGFVKQAP